ncbi:MAG TPA: TolC family protein [Terriglobales bacterium]|nr:TolC family protein [Terriglobales bacterium]
MKALFRSTVWLLTLVCLLAALGRPAAAGDPLPFRRAIELALHHSGDMAIAAADQEAAHQSYLETRNGYLPTIIVGSGVAASYGFPMSLEGAAPSVFNVTTQQYLYNPAVQQFLKAARTDWNASGIGLEDRRDQVILETALVYAELDKLSSTLHLLQEQAGSAQRVEQVVSMRVQAGVDNELEITRAKLTAARVRLSLADAESRATVLRARLAQLTGLPADSIETVTESIPELPAVPAEEVSEKTLDQNPEVRVANERAAAMVFRAKGEHRMLYPSIDLAGQYGLFSKFNNYDQYFKKFQRNNVTFGLEIRFPLFNFSQKARAQAADATALRAQKQAEDVKNRLSVETLRLQGAVKQLAAAREVARLEYTLARADADATGIKLVAGTATVRDQERARLLENDKYLALLDATFQLDQAQMQLLKTTGKLQEWALTGK